ncbi:MAG: gliding motility-associated C-terminal domain-containing protein [Bacteroidia bacterium]|nr:gliding motility-associated C-terminal domain-containing protein [Bacteroidia bacterium]
MKKLGSFLTLGLLLAWYSAFATHNRAGEITYRCLDSTNFLTYEITVTTYTSSNQVDRCSLTIHFGDGDSCVATRSNGNPSNGNEGCPQSTSPGYCPHCGDYLADNVKKNVYKCVHTYSGPGHFTISMYDENRNQGVINITNSVNVPFYIETELFINPILGPNNSVQLLNPPIDKACINIPFHHNAGAYDPDGDSLSYRIVPCSGSEGQDIPNNPGALNNVFMDLFTGDFIWDVPTIIGEFNFAFIIEEWRRYKGDNKVYLVGEVKRDMQVEVSPCLNTPPVIQAPDEICVVAGTQIQFDVLATDADMDDLTLTGTGGPLLMENPASFPQPQYGIGAAQGQFTWNTKCNHVQINPHYMYFRVEDDGGPNNAAAIKLAAYHTTAIRVVGPEPTITQVEPIGSNMKITWNPSECPEVVSYKIYRHVGETGWEHDTCETGVPGYTGYVLIGTTQGINNTTFIDNNNGLGLVSGVLYCYRVVAIFPDNAESYSSDEWCNSLKKDIPIITHVSIFNTDLSQGADSIQWSKPTELDTIAFPGPYRYNLYRTEGGNAANYELIWSNSYPNYYLMNDSVYVETSGLNTLEKSYRYKIELVNQSPASTDTIGNTQASSVYLNLSPDDNQLTLTWTNNVPWSNYKTWIYRKAPSETNFSFLDTTLATSYVDTGLQNGATYCYYVITLGTYNSPAITDSLFNASQQICGIPVDTTPPCQPMLSVIPSCDDFENDLTWTAQDKECDEDALYYKVYYSPTLAGTWQLIYSTSDLNDTTYLHDNLLQSIAGCYAIAGVDSFNNESHLLDSVCVDNCPEYNLPNTFSPDGDGTNDFFTPFPGWRFVQKVDIRIYNRWGNLVFQTTDPNISWNGKIKNSGGTCVDGVYFYVCKADEIRLAGIVTRELKGFIHLFRNAKSGSVD